MEIAFILLILEPRKIMRDWNESAATMQTPRLYWRMLKKKYANEYPRRE